MALLKISNVSKIYQLDDGKEKRALDNVSICFPESGLVAIVGKSGSGKSTLLNMIALLDTPTQGSVTFRGSDINRLKQKRKDYYRNNEIGIVFQNYHLMENFTVLFNTMLPLLISGESTKNAEIAAKNLLESLSIGEDMHQQLCKDLSGGEKERVAIARAIINEPRILLCDEPTGALDSVNSENVMSIFKEISKNRLVVMVSHNHELVRKYADRIITIKDGKIDKIDEINETDDELETIEKKHRFKNSKWIEKITSFNFKRRFKRNFFSITSLIIGLVSSMLIVGFSYGNEDSVRQNSYKQFDYGVGIIQKETVQSISGSKISLVRTTRLSEFELSQVDKYINNFEIEPNTDVLVPSYPIIKIGDTKLETFSYNPVYSFSGNYINKNLIKLGNLPIQNSLFEVVINEAAYKTLKKETNSDPLKLVLEIHNDYESHYYTGLDVNPVITDYFIYQKTVRITGVVEDFNFLTTPKIYYPFVSLKNYLQNYPLINLSEFMKENINWYDRILSTSDTDILSSYSHRIFLKNHKEISSIEEQISDIQEPYKININSITIANTLFDLLNAATIGMEVFLVIAIIGTSLIMGIISFSSYSEDKKTSAILTCLGASKDNIFSIYFGENVIICLIAIGVSFIFSPIMGMIVNKFINKFTTFENMINIPFMRFMDKPFLFPIIIILSALLICIISTYIPLSFSKKISPKEELIEE